VGSDVNLGMVTSVGNDEDDQRADSSYALVSDKRLLDVINDVDVIRSISPSHKSADVLWRQSQHEDQNPPEPKQRGAENVVANKERHQLLLGQYRPRQTTHSFPYALLKIWVNSISLSVDIV
jgi:hypothetical protein